MVSHIVSTFSGKPIFGQDGPKYKFYDFYISKHTICRKLSTLYKQITIQVSHIFYIIYTYTFLSIFKEKYYNRSACISTKYKHYSTMDTVVVLTIF